MGANGRKTSRPTGKLRRYREQKRINAEKRQGLRDARTNQEQLVLLDSRPGASKKERLKLA